MSSVRWVQLLGMVVLMEVSMSGCGRGIFNTEQMTDRTGHRM